MASGMIKVIVKRPYDRYGTIEWIPKTRDAVMYILGDLDEHEILGCDPYQEHVIGDLLVVAEEKIIHKSYFRPEGWLLRQDEGTIIVYSIKCGRIVDLQIDYGEWKDRVDSYGEWKDRADS